MAPLLLKFGTKHLKRRFFSEVGNLFFFHPTFNENEERENVLRDFQVIQNFVTEEEESHLLAEVEPVLKRLRYEVDHWDAAILGYRETEKKNWNNKNAVVLDRVRKCAFGNKSVMPLVHILDLKADGEIKPHVDSIKFCGNTIAGISLLTTSVMRLVKENNSTMVVDVLLPQRSLYIMRGCARYEYTHALLGNECSMFDATPVQKDRRISVICRNDPNES